MIASNHGRPVAGLWVIGSHRPRRVLRRRAWRNWTRSLLSLGFGCLLLGCQSGPSGFTKVDNPFNVLEESADNNARIKAYQVLGKQEYFADGWRKDAIARLAKGATEEANPLVRSTAVVALSHYSEPEAVKALVKAADDKDPLVRRDVALALRQFHDPESAAALGRLATKEADLDVRYAATESLAARHQGVCNPYLLSCLRDKDITVVQAASRGLRANTFVDHGDSYQAWAAYFKGSLSDQTPNLAEKDRLAPGGTLVR